VSKRAELREAIIKTSLELGSQLGEEGLTMRGIASRLGVSATALYQHFESKNQILREIRTFGIQQLWAAMQPAIQANESVADQLRDMCKRYVGFAVDNPWLYTVLMQHEEVNWAALADKEGELEWPLRPLLELRKLLEQGRNDGAFQAEYDVVTASLQMWAAVHGLSSLLINGRIDEKHPMFPAPDKNALVDQFARTLVATLRPNTA